MHLVSECGGRRGSWRYFDVLERRRFIQRTNQWLTVDVTRAESGVVQDAHQTLEFELADLPLLVARGFVHIAMTICQNFEEKNNNVVKTWPTDASYC